MIPHTKVKFFSDTDLERLEKNVNEFTKQLEVIDIKITESTDDWTCLVIYRGADTTDKDVIFHQKTPKNDWFLLIKTRFY